MLLRLMLVFSLAVTSCAVSDLNRKMDSDSPDYEKWYDQLDAEYGEALYKTSAGPGSFQAVTSNPKWVKQFDEASANEAGENPPEADVQGEPMEETNAAAVSRLRCDNPWFWNTFKCVWLDLRAHRRLDRTRRNFKVAGILGGILAFFTLLPICCFCGAAFFLKARVAKYSSLMDRYMKEYMPGSIILPNGQVKYYDPTPEEEEAFENLIHVISSPV